MALLLRLNKAAPLTNAETDNNFLYLDGVCTSLTNLKLNTSDLLAQIKLIDGIGSGVDADKVQGYTPSDQALINSIVLRDASGNFSANTITATTFVGAVTEATNAQNVLGIVPILHGGTGVSALTSGYLKSNGTIFQSFTSIPAADIAGDIAGLSANITGIAAIANGGTGASTIGGAQMNLGLIPGQTVQTYSSNLQNLSGIGTVGFVYLGTGTATTRTLTFGSCLNITNPNGTNGNPLLELTVVDITHGGTGANNAASARQSLGVPASVDSILSGTPTAPTAPNGTVGPQIATCDFVINNSVPTGAIITMATSNVPFGYLENNGQLVLRASYPKLFATISTRFGIGNGSTTFQLPTVAVPAGFISVIKT